MNLAIQLMVRNGKTLIENMSGLLNMQGTSGLVLLQMVLIHLAK